MSERFPPMRPTPAERLNRAEDASNGGVLYLTGNYRRLVLAALLKAFRDGVKAGRAEQADLAETLEAMIAMQNQMARKPSGGGGALPADYGIIRGRARAALAKAKGETS